MLYQNLLRVLLFTSLVSTKVGALPRTNDGVLAQRDLIGDAVLSTEDALESALGILSGEASVDIASSFASLIQNIVPSPTPSNTQNAFSLIQSIYQAQPTNALAVAANMVLSGVTGESFPPATENSLECSASLQSNTQQPSFAIYPQASSDDAPYDITEDDLRSAIFVPGNFTYGKIPPVLFVPGTGVTACEVYTHNLAKLFGGSSYADPVYLNIPGPNLGDAQDNAEYIAYAINYISSITSPGGNLSIVTFSAGSIETAWALKYWPSTQKRVSNIINVSSDYHGTETLPLFCPPGTPCAPLFLQNSYNSNFLNALRANDTGSSAYVPTTVIYTEFDEIIVPQSGLNASAIIEDIRNVGVMNACTQSICAPPLLAGDPDSGHEDTLFNPLPFVLARDALINGGPANAERAGASAYCNDFLAPGLDLTDLLYTQALLPLALLRILTYSEKVTQEPLIKAYAL